MRTYMRRAASVNIILRGIISLPEPSSLPKSIINRLEKSDQEVAELRMLRCGDISKFLSVASPYLWKQLHHRLSDVWRERQRVKPLRINTVGLELAALNTMASLSDEPLAFQLRKLVSLVTEGKVCDFRTGKVFIAPDRVGSAIEFADHNRILGQISKLDDYIEEFTSNNPTLVAIVSLVAILNVHPFVDGNGRVARTFFNRILNYNRDDFYIPLCNVIEYSSGGFEIRLRDVEVNGNWVSFIDYIIDVILMCGKLVRQGDQ